jgi:hypothetical protein
MAEIVAPASQDRLTQQVKLYLFNLARPHRRLSNQILTIDSSSSISTGFVR